MTYKVKFVDDYMPFSQNNILYEFLRDSFDLEVVDEPDFLFYSVFGFEHTNPKYDHCVRIWYTGENVRPDFARCDYALSFDHLENEDRHLRFPEYMRSLGRKSDRLDALMKPADIDCEAVLRSKPLFCNFLYSNEYSKIRVRFFRELSKYKRVDSGGPVLNNLGKTVPKDLISKLAFLKQYKFTIAFENARYPGYTTEKIVDPMVVGSIPIYWGNWQVGRDFNTRSFVNCHEYASFDEVVEEVVRLDRDAGRYIAKMREPWLNGNTLNEYMRPEYLVPFFTRIFATPLHAEPKWSNVAARDYDFKGFTYVPDYRPSAHMIGSPEPRIFE